MYKAILKPSHISGPQLDAYLAKGWYRMDQRLFTEQFLQERFGFRNAIWLRQRLKDLDFPGWFKKVKLKSLFRVEVGVANPTPLHEMLYQEYLSSKHPGFPGSLEDILYGDFTENIFDSRMINLYDGEKLIASGFYDVGEKAAEGIVNFYHPDYAKHRLGKFLFLLAMESCLQDGLKYFYPGYLVPGNPRFNYKASFHQGSLEFLDAAQKTWLPFSQLDMDDLPLERMRAQLAELKHLLKTENRRAIIMHNGVYCLNQQTRWDTPVFLFVGAGQDQLSQCLMAYDTNRNEFFLFPATHIYPPTDILTEEDMMICLKPPIVHPPLARAADIRHALRSVLDIVPS